MAIHILKLLWKILEIRLKWRFLLYKGSGEVLWSSSSLEVKNPMEQMLWYRDIETWRFYMEILFGKIKILYRNIEILCVCMETWRFYLETWRFCIEIKFGDIRILYKDIVRRNGNFIWRFGVENNGDEQSYRQKHDKES
jgi:hypothetical protein|uniref:Uncharacterized protein n=1 Tax=Populus trichocarpa TaxID=3694 RepID=B9GTR4_POPTR